MYDLDQLAALGLVPAALGLAEGLETLFRVAALALL